MAFNKNTNISKSMSYLLRHGCEKEHIAHDENGYVLISDLIGWLNSNKILTTTSIIESIVDDDKKNRYTLSSDKTRIRANQGHSVDVGVQYTVVDISSYVPVIHGTYRKHMQSIHETGLSKMDRTHVHMISGRDLESFKRNSSEHSLATALRETYEETGIKPEELTFLQSLTVSEVSASGKHNAIGYFQATTTKIDIKSLDPEEVSASWHTVSFVMDLLQPKRRSILSKLYPD